MAYDPRRRVNDRVPGREQAARRQSRPRRPDAPRANITAAVASISQAQRSNLSRSPARARARRNSSPAAQAATKNTSGPACAARNSSSGLALPESIQCQRIEGALWRHTAGSESTRATAAVAPRLVRSACSNFRSRRHQRTPARARAALPNTTRSSSTLPLCDSWTAAARAPTSSTRGQCGRVADSKRATAPYSATCRKNTRWNA